MIKNVILFFTLYAGIAVFAQDQISIRKFSNAQIQAIFESQIQAMYIKDSDGNVHQIAKHMNRSGWTREAVSYGPRKESVYIVQHIDGGKYIVRQGDTWSLADLGREGYVDGERVDNLILERLSETYQYITVLGAKSTIAVIRAVEDRVTYTPLTYEDFKAALLADRTFDVLLPAQLTCRACNGTGALKERNQKGAATARTSSYRSIICSNCKATGKVPGEKLYRLGK